MRPGSRSLPVASITRASADALAPGASSSRIVPPLTTMSRGSVVRRAASMTRPPRISMVSGMIYSPGHHTQTPPCEASGPARVVAMLACDTRAVKEAGAGGRGAACGDDTGSPLAAAGPAGRGGSPRASTQSAAGAAVVYQSVHRRRDLHGRHAGRLGDRPDGGLDRRADPRAHRATEET